MPVYPEIWAGPARSYRRDTDGDPILSRKKYITIHNTSNDATAEGEAAYAKVRTDGTSSHYYCDHDSILQSLNTDWCAGHVGSYEGNTYGISYEITGFNSWTRDYWLTHVAWELAARQMVVDCREFGIPARLLTIDEMRAKTYKGFITHDMARIAWGGTTHTDPGPGFPMDQLLHLVQSYLGDDMNAEQDRKLTVLDRLYVAIVTDSDTIDDVPLPDGGGVIDQPFPLAKRVKELAARPPAQLSDEQLAKVADMVAAKLPKPLTADDVRAILRAEIDAVKYAPQRMG